ncbi:ATP-dependent Clp protease ATP-binding subunit [Actinomadura kijaniata]|uniref:AAA family ATPase n=1 Tax=Actinomadura kijaniata TaxID=46161 RepID=UPI002FEC0758
MLSFSLLFTDGLFTPQRLGDPRAADVLHAATDRASDRVRTSDLLHAAVAAGDPALLPVLARTLPEGVAERHLLAGIEIYNPGRSPDDDGPAFDGRRERFDGAALAALRAFDAEFASLAAADPGRARHWSLELLVAAVLENLDADDREYLGAVLDPGATAAVLRERVRVAGRPPAPLLEEGSGRLRSEEFTEDGWAVLEQAAARAAELGYDRVLPPHVLLALLGQTEGTAEHLVRLQVPPQMGPVRVAEIVAEAFRLLDGGRPRPGAAPPLDRAGLRGPTLDLLAEARRDARGRGADRVGPDHLLGAVLADPPQRLRAVLTAPPLALDLDLLRDNLERRLRDAGTPHETAFRLPPGLPPSQDLTWLARTGGLAPAPHLDRYFDPLCRALHRAEAHHVLITGDPGTGTTTLLGELARRAAAGEIPFLRRKRFLHVDCGDVAPGDSAAALAGIVGHVAGRTDVIVCADGLGALLRGPHGTDHRLALRAALKEGRLHLVGVLTPQDFEDLVGADRALLELTTRIEVAEPGPAEARDMAARAAGRLAERFGVRADDRAVDLAVVLSSDLILSERLPAKAVRVLHRACEDLHYRRSQAGETRDTVGPDDVVEVVAELSGVPAAQIHGGGERTDFARVLSESVVGQPGAVRAVAAELRRVKAGLAGPGRPASVMLFAGLTGVGKTETAKTLARVYSASKRLRTYPMENFAEPHSIAGIIGSPPGYVGHDSGGRLVNDLNADPYCVFLLDEAEKAHPEVWRPFLNLFDEGWITDQRGVKAFADRAVFILTTNAGHDLIAEMAAAGRPDEDIAAAVRRVLREVRHPRSGQATFPPEFLARLRQVVVFRPLDRAAMAGICARLLREQREFWRARRGKDLVVPEALAGHIADLAYAADRGSGGAEGGRVVSRLVSRLVEDPITLAADRDPGAFRAAGRVELLFRPGGDPPVEAVPR